MLALRVAPIRAESRPICFVVQELLHADLVADLRHALYYAVTGEPFDGRRAVEIGLINFAVPGERLRDETMKLAEKLLKLNPGVVRSTREAIRAVRGMSDEQARDYLRGKQDSLSRTDKVEGPCP